MYVCARCMSEMRVEKNEVIVSRRYKGVFDCAYFADLWVCPSCGHRILVTAPRPFASVPDKEPVADFVLEVR